MGHVSMKNKTKQIAEKIGLGVCRKWMSVSKLDMFTEEIVNECIKAVEEAKIANVYTTYDKDVSDSTKAHCIQAIIMKFKE